MGDATERNIERLPTGKAERRIAFERKAHRAALSVKNAVDKKAAVRTFFHYLKLSI